MINKEVRERPINHTVEKIRKRLDPLVLKGLGVFLLGKEPTESAINGTQLVVKFTKAVDASTVIGSDGTLKDGVFSISPVGTAMSPFALGHTTDNLKASLSADGTTLTVNADTYFSGSYAVTVADNAVYTADGSATIPAYSSFVNVSDTTRPTLTGVTYNDIKHAVLHFSEPVQDLTNVNVNIVRADGTALTTPLTKLNVSQGTDPSTYIVDLGSLAAVDQNQNLTVTLTGIQDAAGNLLSPNPAVATVKYDNTNTTKTTVSSVTVTGTKTFDIKFSGSLTTDPTVAIDGGTPLASTSVVKDSTDPTVYHVTNGSSLNDLHNVTVSGFAGSNYVTGDTVTKVVNFNVPTTGPSITSSAVQKINGVEYLVLTYNENVTPGTFGTPTGSYFDPSTAVTTQNVTYTTAAGPYQLAVTSLLPYGATTSNQVKVALSSLASGTYNINLPAGFVTDGYSNPSVASSTISFNRTTDASTLAPNATVTKSVASNDKVEVNFDQKVDPTTALNTANYSVEGANVTGAVLTANATGSATVELTLASGSNTYTGSHYVTVSGVKSAAGVLMNAFKGSVNLTENVKPQVTAAALTDTKTITLTFSKGVNTSVATDFDVYAGGTELSGFTTQADSSANGATTLTLTTSTALTAAQVASGIVVKPDTSLNVSDTDGNALNFSSITVK